MGLSGFVIIGGVNPRLLISDWEYSCAFAFQSVCLKFWSFVRFGLFTKCPVESLISIVLPSLIALPFESKVTGEPPNLPVVCGGDGGLSGGL